MTRIVLGAVVATLILTGTTAMPALADCAEDIKKVEKKKEGIDFSKERLKGVVEGILERAKTALAEGNKNKCEKLVERADHKIDMAN